MQVETKIGAKRKWCKYEMKTGAKCKYEAETEETGDGKRKNGAETKGNSGERHQEETGPRAGGEGAH